MNRLECRLRLRYSNQFALDAEFTADRAVTALFGASGSGKTTLLECLAGVRRPDAGRIVLNGRVLYDAEAKIDVPPQQRRIGVVFQEHCLFPHLNVEANLLYGHRQPRRGTDAAESSRNDTRKPIKLADVARVLELEDLLRRRPDQLSGGQKQRVALGRALLSCPDLLLMDEPLAALDDSLKHRVLDYLERAIAAWEIPVLLVTHSLTEVQRLADRVVLIESGRVVATGAPEELLALPQWLAAGHGFTNLLRLAELNEHEGHWRAKLGTQWLWLPPRSDDAPPPQFAECDPGAVLLAARNDQNVSARNHLAGIVQRVVPGPRGAYVAVDVGQILWSLVTPEAVAELALEPGKEILCLLKAHSLKWLN